MSTDDIPADDRKLTETKRRWAAERRFLTARAGPTGGRPASFW